MASRYIANCHIQNNQKEKHIATIKTHFDNLINGSLAIMHNSDVRESFVSSLSKKFILNQAVPRLAVTPRRLHEFAGAFDLSHESVSNFSASFLRLVSCRPYLFHAAFLCALESGENEFALGVIACFAASDEEGKQACRIRFLLSAYILNTLPCSLGPVLHLLIP